MPPKRKTATANTNKAIPPVKKTKGKNTEETPEHFRDCDGWQWLMPGTQMSTFKTKCWSHNKIILSPKDDDSVNIQHYF